MRNILFLQGPVGHFFAKFQQRLEFLGYNTYSIGFNYADWFFAYKPKFTLYKKKFVCWKNFLEDFILENNIERIYLFGDGRIYHRVAKKLAKKYNIEVFVFEEGYIRPNFITLEKDGVNGFSKIPKDRNFYESLPKVDEFPKTEPIPFIFNLTAFVAITYYIILGLTKFLTPVIHHRNSNLLIEFINGHKNFFRKIFFKIKEKKLLKDIQNEKKLSNKYFLGVLQTDNDFQLKLHSKIKNNTDYIKTVITSFAKYKNSNTQDSKYKYLIFKHHPLDRGRKNYDYLINKLAKQHHLEKFIISTHDLHLPTVINHSLGVITINSTVGLSALRHKKPVATLGKAIYNIDEIVSHIDELDDFWANYKEPDEVLLKKFFNYIFETTQIKGSFYKGFPKELMSEFQNLNQIKSLNLNSNFFLNRKGVIL